jgi:hypothetical protein
MSCWWLRRRIGTDYTGFSSMGAKTRKTRQNAEACAAFSRFMSVVIAVRKGSGLSAKGVSSRAPFRLRVTRPWLGRGTQRGGEQRAEAQHAETHCKCVCRHPPWCRNSTRGRGRRRWPRQQQRLCRTPAAAPAAAQLRPLTALHATEPRVLLRRGAPLSIRAALAARAADDARRDRRCACVRERRFRLAEEAGEICSTLEPVRHELIAHPALDVLSAPGHGRTRRLPSRRHRVSRWPAATAGVARAQSHLRVPG